ncbi:MAG: class I adenylate-forming enzyme family protein, partial [Staphylococcus saprophyticus]
PPGHRTHPDAPATAFSGEFFLTGDLAKIDEDGDVYIVDRRKEMIITGGENVLPSEVERVLSEHPLVAQGVVVGYDSPKYGESVSAAVVLTEDDPDFEQKLDAHMREHIAGYKIPRLYLKLTHIPLNSTSKPDKLEIQKYMNDKAQKQDQSKDELT